MPRVLLKDFAVYLFAVAWPAFSLSWTFRAMGGAAASWDRLGPLIIAFPLFGLPFIVFALGMLSVPFVPLLLGRGVAFAVTDRRLLRFVLAGRLRTQAIPGDRIGSFDRTERSDGSSNLSIVVGSNVDSGGDLRWTGSTLAKCPT